MNLLSSLFSGLAEQLSPAPAIDDGPPIWVPDPDNAPQCAAYICPADELFYGGEAGGGKACHVETLLPTPTGWKKMGDVLPGDFLLSDAGLPCRVKLVSKTFYNHTCYAVEFDDGERIIVDAEHRWLTFSYQERMRQLRDSSAWREKRRSQRQPRGLGKRPDLAERNRTRSSNVTPAPTGTVRTTQEIFDSLRVRGGRVNHSIPVCSALILPETSLAVAPYTLGAWLGDGKTAAGRIYTSDLDRAILERIGLDSYTVRKIPSEPLGWTVLGLQPLLRQIGVLGNKHIPAVYLRASFEQRLALLQGLMDTDGTCDADGGAEYTSVNQRLAEGVLELARTLGVKATLTQGRAKLNGRDCGPKYRVKITTDLQVFHLKRKADKQRLTVRPTQKQRYIIACYPVRSVPVKCVAVDAPSHLYLAGAGFVPTHNTDLLLGLAGTAHRKSLILRREFPTMRSMIERSRQIYNRHGDLAIKDSFNEQLHIWRLVSGRMIEFGALLREETKEKYRGRDHDAKLWDEMPQFTATQYSFVNAWNRTTVPGQRCRVVGAGNPPMTLEGRWVVERWAAWLNSKHGKPAKSGEIRWYATLDGEEVEVESGQPFTHKTKDGREEKIIPSSRTFIRARLDDNKYLRDTNYRAQIQKLPEPMRSMMLEGLFDKQLEGDVFQVIPNSWVMAAIERWRKSRRPDRPISVMGADLGRGGDKTVFAKKVGHWYAPLVKYPGAMTRSGVATVDLLVLELEGQKPVINLDVIGIGSSVFDELMRRRYPYLVGTNFGESADGRSDRTGLLQFHNLRAWAWWNLRDALDPSNNPTICLPDDDELLADLTSPRWKQQTTGKILIEEKTEIKKRLGRSTDCGDAVVYAEMFAADSNPDDWLKAYQQGL